MLDLRVRSWARDNTATTTGTCFPATSLLVIAVYLYLLWLLHFDIETLIFFVFYRIVGMVFVVAKLKNCRAPSSATQWPV